ncbi:MAG: hydantoinase/oxoprolinase family protein [Betaproteobacteria bacterium]|nr:hydantoinase/oxoprolinase family protein [Betaproteobacteria bacterium]
MLRVATDVGGTFTDCVAFDEQTGILTASKASTSADIIAGIVECFRKSGTAVAGLDHFVHGSTVAINTVIERKGARTGLLATEGFRHVLDLGRGNIPNSFDLMFETPRPLVPPHLRHGVRERMLSDGTVLTALDAGQALAGIKALAGNGLDSIAICLLHSYANPDHERALKRLVEEFDPKLYVTASSDIIRQYREYERTSTTVLNAYIGPKVGAYLHELAGFLGKEAFRGTSMIMQSNGGTMTIEAARAQPVRMMESGPVGGTMAAAYVGKQLGYDNVVAFDMGGTTAKVSMVKKGEIEVSDGYFIGGEETGYPLQLPVVDIIEIGAGGGSIAHLDETGALKVGPLSAGAVPGPVCYGRGGTQPTVTDADLLLGRLNPGYFLGGEIALHPAQAVLVVAFGGAGPLHAVSVARELRIKTVVVPPFCGIFSAVGMLLADAKDEYVLSHIRAFDAAAAPEINRLFATLEVEGAPAMMRAGFTADRIVMKRALEMRYIGQEFTLLVDSPERELTRDAMDEIRRKFNRIYETRYGHAFPELAPEIVSLRLRVYGIFAKPELKLWNEYTRLTESRPRERRPVYFEEAGFVDCAVYQRPELPVNRIIHGPLVIEEHSATTVISSPDSVTADEFGNLVISVRSGS